MTVRPLLGACPGAGRGAGAALATALGLLAAQLAERVAVVALALGVADYLLVAARGTCRAADDARRGEARTQGIGGRSAATGRERQRLHRELLEQRMIADVRKADFVVVNPDHIAVALRYDRDGEAAPVVVANGERLLAEQIKQVAREAGVPIFRDVTLARVAARRARRGRRSRRRCTRRSPRSCGRSMRRGEVAGTASAPRLRHRPRVAGATGQSCLD